MSDELEAEFKSLDMPNELDAINKLTDIRDHQSSMINDLKKRITLLDGLLKEIEEKALFHVLTSGPISQVAEIAAIAARRREK